MDTEDTVMPDALPAYASTLQSIYGEPSSGAWGSAVFHAAMPSGASLEDAAFATYRTFVGPAWERFGAEAWTGGWQRVHERPAAGPRDLIAELRAIEDREVRMAVPMVIDDHEQAEAGRAALAAAFDDPAVTELLVHHTGDGEAMSGFAVSALRDGAATHLLFLLD
ncbi:MAG: hypothetical protein R3F05_06075 [Planctomycetota bacterium]